MISTYWLTQALSALLHPLLMPTWLHVILFAFAPTTFSRVDDTSQWRLLFVIFILTFLLPLVFIYFLFQYGLVGFTAGTEAGVSNPTAAMERPGRGKQQLWHNLQMQDRTQRFVPFLCTTFIYGADTFLFTRTLSTLYLSVVILGAVSVCIGLVTIITLIWKISAHAVGIGGLIGFLFAISYHFTALELLYPTVVMVIVAGLLLSARLYLNAHTPSQVGGGFLLGLSVCFAAVLLFV